MEARHADAAAARARQWPHALRRFLETRLAVDLRSLALFRIAVGVILVADSLLRTRDFTLMFAPDGLFPPDKLRDFFGHDPSEWSLALLLDRSWPGGAVLALEGLAGACLAVGWWTTTATVVAWAAVVSVFRRTLPAANAGDLLLSCLLFWSIFLPLGDRWSIDAWRRSGTGRGPQPAPRRPSSVFSIATAALVLQVMAVYIGAGVAKCNATWLNGDAMHYALSVHDHGTPLGTWLARADWLTRPLTWTVIACEIMLPLIFIAWPSGRVRLAIATTFILFHAAIWATMTVGLFAPIGIAAWLPLLPAAAWSPRHRGRLPSAGEGHNVPPHPSGEPLAAWLCAAAALLAAVSFFHDVTPWRAAALPRPIQTAINAASLRQEWGMFGTVPPLEQWVYGRAELVDGRVVDLLRNGRTLEPERPAGGFWTLPHHRWHKVLWVLPRPKVRIFAPSFAAALVRHWNARHDAESQVVSLEIRFAQHNLSATDAPIHEMLVASWPDRTASGTGNLDRLVEARAINTPER
jgi:hypothetical protein